MVTTATVTHATPAVLYASAANRDWESDSGQAEDGLTQEEIKLCPDIAKQMIEDKYAQNMKVKNIILLRDESCNFCGEGWRKMENIFPPPSEKNKKLFPQGSDALSDGQLIYVYLLIIRKNMFSSNLKIEKNNYFGR